MTLLNRITRTMPLIALLAVAASAVASARDQGSAARQPSRFDGATIYKVYCASCHGEWGRGNGPVAIYLRRRPADLTQIAKRNKGKFPSDRVFQLIDGRQVVKAHGGSQMPVWGDAFSKAAMESDEQTIKEKIGALVRHLESIQETQAEPRGSSRK
jgi:mono/diheme cytochrome c family protein